MRFFFRQIVQLTFIVLTSVAIAQSPHGDGLKIYCAACHTSEGWNIPQKKWDLYQKQAAPKISRTTGMKIGFVKEKFSHETATSFPLTGRHNSTNCRECHPNLVFEQAESSCISCHQDIHQMTAGNDCARCHSTDGWIVSDIQSLHQQNGFPLSGVLTESGMTV